MDITKPPSYWQRLTGHNGDPFRGAALKIKRAERHLHELANAARSLRSKQAVYFVIGAEPKTGRAQIIWHINPMPLEFAATMGDAVHNIRSAFDYIAVALTSPPIGKGNPKNAYFPTGKNREEFLRARDGYATSKGKWVKGKMENAHPRGATIIEELEPYVGGKHSLRALHDLDILDKHKLLVPAIADITINRLDVTVDGTRHVLSDSDFQGRTALIDQTVAGPESIVLDGEFDTTFTVVFRKGQPLEGAPVVETLQNMAEVAKATIKTCQNDFPGYVTNID